MKRRTAIRSILTLPAALALPVPLPAQEAAPAPAASNEMPDTPTVAADTHADTVVKAFNADQFAALNKLSSILVPSLPDTPGGLDAKAAEFLDFLISQSPPDRVMLYNEGLDRLNQEARKRTGKPFGEITAEQARPILAPLHEPWAYEPSTDPFTCFLRAAKEDILKATRNSRQYISVVSRRNRRAGGMGIYWYPIND
ncbi:MAG TPA: gluconate 2-dehydrogenase subunit 3 family protein [Terriglobia bacterium]|nr:gluconate 2-dehydrogenase subunit 3 family protein [Terriglobia bacterium]